LAVTLGTSIDVLLVLVGQGAGLFALATAIGAGAPVAKGGGWGLERDGTSGVGWEELGGQ
jgi:hypothetical protein